MSVNIQERFTAMPLGEKIILIAAPLFFIVGFLPWFDYDIAGFDGPSRSGWSGDFSFFSMIAILLALAMAAVIAIQRFTTIALPALPAGVTWARVYLGASVYIALAVLLRLVLGESAGPFDADMAFGIWLAVLVAAALVVGAGMLFMAERQGGGGGTTTSM